MPAIHYFVALHAAEHGHSTAARGFEICVPANNGQAVMLGCAEAGPFADRSAAAVAGQTARAQILRHHQARHGGVVRCEIHHDLRDAVLAMAREGGRGSWEIDRGRGVLTVDWSGPHQVVDGGIALDAATGQPAAAARLAL